MTAPAPIKVMHVITGLGLGGAESMLYALATAPGAKSLNQSIVSLVSEGHYAYKLLEAGERVWSLGMRRGIPGPRGVLTLARLIARERPDVVQGWMYHADLVAMAALVLSGRRDRTPLVWGIRASLLHGPSYGRAFRIARRLWIALAPRADMIIANSQAGIEAHVALGMHARRTLVIANGIDTEKFRPDPDARARLRSSWNVSSETRLIAHVARLDPIKDHGTFLAAVDRLPQARAILVGQGTEELPKRQNVIALGSRFDVPHVLAACDIVASSSLSEGFSNALVEGMAAGLPAVATDVGDARAILGDTGVLCPPRDPAALAAAIKTLLDEPEKDFNLRAAAARRRIVDNFSLERAADAFIRAYRTLVPAA